VIARREFMLGAAAAGVLMQPRFGYAKASQPATNVNFDVQRARVIATRISMAIRSSFRGLRGAHIRPRRRCRKK
jgi:hypothetical protein